MGLDEAKRYRETSFGPPSESIQPNEFAKDAATSVRSVTKELTALWKKTKKQTRDHVQAELRCVHTIITTAFDAPDSMDKVSLNDLQEQTGNVMENENLRNVFAQRYAEHAVKRKEHDAVQTQSHPAGTVFLLHMMASVLIVVRLPGIPNESIVRSKSTESLAVSSTPETSCTN